MDRTHIELLDGFLADPADPRWSSSAMDRMFASVEGDAKQKLLKVIQPVDDRLVDSCSDLTREQTEFLRSVTLFAYTTGCVCEINAPDVNWLISRFESTPTSQRALAIALPVHPGELPPDIQTAIIRLLAGTPGERFLDSRTVTGPKTT